MSYRVMAIDECGTEVLAGSGYASEDEAYSKLPTLRDDHPEWRGFNVEYEMTAMDYINQQDDYYGENDYE